MRTLGIAIALMATGACSEGDKQVAAGKGAEGSVRGGGASSGPVAIPAGVPASAAVVGVVRSPWALGDAVARSVLPMDPGIARELRADLTTVVRERFGVDPMSVSSAIVFAIDADGDPAVAVLVPGITGELAGPAAGSHAGVSLYPFERDGVLALTGGTALVGHRDAVTAAIDVAKGRGTPLAADSKLGSLLTAGSDGAMIAIAVDPSAVKAPQVDVALGKFGVTGAALHIGQMGIRVRVDASESGAKQLEDMARGGLAMASAELDAQLAAAKSQAGIEALGAVFGVHHARNAVKQLSIAAKGTSVTARLPVEGTDSTVVVAVIGVAAAVAIPAFMKYIKTSKTTEARQFVTRIYQGARAGYLDSGKFPTSTPLAPANPTACCEKCAPDASLWAGESWVALQFAVDDPHYYSYQFETDGKTEFTARAFGDLDCDGVWSTFEMYGTVKAGDIAASPALLRSNELE